jgi:protein-tyrosine phosphatase
MHIVPGVDDGPRSISESLEMLKFAKSQGVSDVFCTSHNVYSEEDGTNYTNAFEQLKTEVESENLGIRLHKGCEVLCASEYIEDIVYGLDIGAFSTLGNTKYVLTELYPDAKPSEALFIIDTLKKSGYKPIIAHMERNYNITGIMVGTLVQSGALIQINLNSLVETDTETRERARQLLARQYVHFVGSDAHRIDYRPPNLTSGVNYVLTNTDAEYATKILSGNANLLLLS